MPLTKPNGAAIPTDYVHGRQPKEIHFIQNDIRRDSFSEAAIPIG